ncbi:MAG: DUF1015 family protein [Firmicutes bacterium]|nr:DUF1015 family protein [Bacillota bacterium]
MADIRPFQAYRPAQGMAQTIAALPYDVYTRQEAAAYVAEHPDSFLAIDRAETAFPSDVDTYDDRVYKKAAELLRARMQKGDFIQEDKPCFYVYEQTFMGRTQTGIVACASVDDYLTGVIRRHENTVEVKEKDRIRHVDACGAQTGPVFLAYRHQTELDQLLRDVTASSPVYDFVSDGDVRNRVFLISDEGQQAAVRSCFAKIPRLYIADGHHRCASAVKVACQKRKEHPDYTGDEPFNYILSVIFPDDQLQILDYNRVVLGLCGLDKSEVLGKIRERFQAVPYNAAAKPTRKGEIGMFIGRRWYMLTPKFRIPADPVESLDVEILQKNILEPVFHITDPRTDPSIAFVGGIKGTKVLEEMTAGSKGCAFAMYPTSIRELFAVADAGRLMPPKSTWFEPKLLSGLFIHPI